MDTTRGNPTLSAAADASPADTVKASARRSWIPLEGSIVLPIFALAFFLPIRGLESLGIALPLPTNSIAAILLILLATWYRPRWSIGSPLLVTTVWALLLWLLLSSYLAQGSLEPRRFVNILTLVLIAGVIASGRLHMRSLTRGALAGLVVALAASAILLPRSSYVGRLSGLLADPNAAGYALVTLGLALAQAVRSPRRRWILVAVIATGTILTLSRTSMFALAVGLLWILVARRLNLVVGAIALTSVVWLYQFAVRTMEARGLFVDRDGSDALRDRLLLEENRLVDSAGWLGHGLGNNIVQLDDNVSLFFHNSYLAIQSEGGRIGIGLVILLVACLYLRFFSLPNNLRPVWAEAGLIASFICAFNIGFALTSPPFAVAIGLLLAYQGFAREALGSQGTDPMLATHIDVSLARPAQ